MTKNLSLLFALFFVSLIFAQSTDRSLSKEKWEFAQASKQQFYPATVPGVVHLDLMKNNLIPDPYKDLNEKKVQWIENEDWIYQTTFNINADEAKSQNIDLVFDGLDTFAEIYLNDKLLKSTNNMFRTWEIPVKPVLKKGENALKIIFKSPVNEGNTLAKAVPFTMPETPRSFVRKAQYQFGWDWGPRLITSGIWKDVHLNFWNNARINTLKVEQKLVSTEKAELNFHLDIEVKKPGNYKIRINEKEYASNLKAGKNSISLPLNINQPKLWQPNGWGKAELYTFNVTLLAGNKTIDKKSTKIGLRTIELVQEKDQKGKSFYFKVNGKPMYARGTNWIPSDSFTPRISKEKYWKLIEDAKNSNFNMIRIWGGGIYEDEEFYNACDENGILVWQDFMFAGSFYPSDPTFLDNVKEEVKDQVNRLQNHPSIALWCGNNEVDEAIVNWGYQKQFKYSKADSLQVWEDYRKVFHQAIPEALTENLTPEKNYYWPSSPSIGWGHKKSLNEGDSHYWGVWWGEQPFEVYNQKVPRFASEYGFQGMPSIAAFKSMFEGNPDLKLDNPTIQHHQKNNRGWQIIANYMQRDYPVPTDFEKYTYVSQILQARGMRIAIEAHRRNKPYNMGSLYWQLNDCWPVVSWSSIDYLGNWKALQYQSKKSFENVVILCEEKDSQLSSFAVNDGLTTYDDLQLLLSLKDFNGKILSIHSLKSNSSLSDLLKFENIELKKLLEKHDKNNLYLEQILKDKDGKVLATNLHFFGKPKELKLAKPTLTIKKISDKEIEISTNVFAKDVYLDNKTGNLSDNYFDLQPGEKKTISCENPIEINKTITLADILEQ